MRLTPGSGTQARQATRSVGVGALALAIVGFGVLRWIVILLVLPEGSATFPDELSYASLTGLLAGGGDWQGWNAGEGATLVPGSLALLGPATVVVKAGMAPLAAVRLVSVAFSVAAQLAMLAIVCSPPLEDGDRPARRLPVRSWRMLSVAVLVLLPSTVFWTSLGLKDSIVSASCLFAVLACTRLTRATRAPQRALWSIVLMVGLLVQLVARAYVLIALVAALGTYLVWMLHARLRRTGDPARATRLVVAAGGAAVVVLAVLLLTAPGMSGGTSLAGRIVTSVGAQSPLQHLDALPGIRARAARVGASGFTIESCPLDAAASPACEALRLPWAFVTVVARPSWPVDPMPDWSPTWARLAPLAQLDTMLLCALLALTVILLARHRSRSRSLAALALVYLSIAWLGLALTEGSLGALMRHRLVLLWPLCLLIALTGPLRRGVPSRSENVTASTEGEAHEH